MVNRLTGILFYQCNGSGPREELRTQKGVRHRSVGYNSKDTSGNMKITKSQLRRVIREAFRRGAAMPIQGDHDYDRGYSDGWNGVEPARGQSKMYAKGYDHGEAAADEEDEGRWREAPEASAQWHEGVR